MRTPIFMGTTQIPPVKTAGEIQALLVAAGASQIATEFGKDQRITGLRWVMNVRGSDWLFVLPVRIEPVYQLMRRRQRTTPDYNQAERTAWRQLLRWVQAQMALIEVGMVDAAEVFTPYVQMPTGTTLYQALAEGSIKALSSPETRPQ